MATGHDLQSPLTFWLNSLFSSSPTILLGETKKGKRLKILSWILYLPSSLSCTWLLLAASSALLNQRSSSKCQSHLEYWTFGLGDDFHFRFQANTTLFTSVRAAWKIGGVLQNVRSAEACGISCLELGRGVCDAIQYDRSDEHQMELLDYPNCE